MTVTGQIATMTIHHFQGYNNGESLIDWWIDLWLGSRP